MIDFDAIADLDAPIEPWQPKVGDRVRIRLGGECNIRPAHEGVTLSGRRVPDPGTPGHADPCRDGLLGTVIERPPGLGGVDWRGHTYAVRYDHALVGTDNVIGSFYAACELEPLA